MTTSSFDAGRAFIQQHGRLLERRIAEVVFDAAAPDIVVAALSGYQNADGGFGQALEPDTRYPASLPIYTEVALQSLVAAGAGGSPASQEMVRRACDQLGDVSEPGGAVALANPLIEGFARAAHWTDWTYQPALNPTAGLAGLLYELGVDHPWLARATSACWSMLDDGGVPRDAHALSETLQFLAHVPDRERAASWFEPIRTALPTVAMFHLDPTADGYGLTPLDLAPDPSSTWRAMFADEVIDGHLQRVRDAQLDDGGWPIAWDPPGPAALVEWRGIVTLRNLLVLHAYDRR